MGIVDASNFDESFDDEFRQVFEENSGPRILALNKTDQVSANTIESLTNQIQNVLPNTETIPVSAMNGSNLPHLKERLENSLPLGPQLYPEDMLADQPERFFVSEFIREQIFHELHQELPYSIAVQIEEFREDRTKVYIRANIVVERQSQKGIVIGAKGKTLKSIGKNARKKIETFLDHGVYLDLHVKVYEKWRKNEFLLRELGYPTN